MKIVFSKGDNYKFNEAGLKTNIKKGSMIDEGDTIHIAQDGMALLRIPGHSLMKLDSGSEVVVDQLPEIINKEEVVEPAILKQIKGAILIEMEKTSDNDTLQIRSKSATMGVRGTKFLVATAEDVTLAVNEGTVEIQNESGNADFVTKSESMVVENGRNFTGRQKHAALSDINWDVRSERATKWKEVRSKFRENFKKRRKDWKPNKERYQKFKKRWQERKTQSNERIKKLMRDPKVRKRVEDFRERRKKRNERRMEKPASKNRPRLDDRMREKVDRLKEGRDRSRQERLQEVRKRRRKRLRRREIENQIPKSPTGSTHTEGTSN